MSFDFEKLMEFGLTEGEKHFQRLVKSEESGESPPIETLRFLAGAGRKILAGENPKKALKLEKTRGRKKDDGLAFSYKLMAVQVICGLMDEHNFTKEQALDRLAALLSEVKGYSRHSLEDHYDAYHRMARDSNKLKQVESVIFGKSPAWATVVEKIIAGELPKK